MEIQVSNEKGRVPVTVMHVDGNIDSATYEAFESKAKALMQAGARDSLVDLEHAPFVRRAGLRALISIFNQLRALALNVSDEQMHAGINAGTFKSRHSKLLNPSKSSMLALEQSGFSMFPQIFTT